MMQRHWCHLLFQGVVQPVLVATDQLAEGRGGDPAGFFRDDKRKAVGFLGDADGSAVARAEGARKCRVDGKRKEAGSGRNAVLLDDDGSVM